MHLCQRFFQSSKHLSHSIFGIAFNSFSNARLMSSMAVKRRHFKALLIFGNRKQSHTHTHTHTHTQPCLANMEAGASLQYCFCPKIHEEFGTYYAATRFIPKTFKKISWHEPIDMPTSSATYLIVIRRSFITISFTFSTFASVVDVLRRPGRSSSSTSLRPS